MGSTNTLSEKSKALAQQIESFISKEISSNGIKNAIFYSLKNVTTPITLIEMGFMTNPDDRKLLTSVEGQDRIVEAIYNRII